MPSKGRAFADLLNPSGLVKNDKLEEGAVVGGGSNTTTYADMAALVLATGMSDGDQAFVLATNNLYIYKTNGWFKIANVENLQPGSISGVESSYALATDGTPTVITAIATDPEGFPLTWSYAVTTGSLGSTATVSQTDNVFTITPSTTEADEGSFSITFSVTDGVNGAVSAGSDFTLSFIQRITATLPGGSPTEEVLPYTSLFNGSVTYNGDGPTTFTPSSSYTARVTLVGAGGGNSNYSLGNTHGGSGGMVVADVTLSAGTTYYLYVGGGGDYATTDGSGGLGGWPNGGTGTRGDASGGGGGGMTMLSTSPFSTSMSDSDIILIAGGGGGSTGYRNGGHGGGSTGGSGPGNSAGGGGTGATQSAGGTFNGSKLQGGDATGLRTSGTDDGGGGGGGYYGGGGGTADANGGGGGSGYANPSLTSNVTFYMATTHGTGANGSSYGIGAEDVASSAERIGGNGVAIIESI